MKSVSIIIRHVEKAETERRHAGSRRKRRPDQVKRSAACSPWRGSSVAGSSQADHPSSAPAEGHGARVFRRHLFITP